MYKGPMQAIEDITIGKIFSIWDSTAELAAEIGEDPDRVRKWPAGRIPVECWLALIEAAARKGREITLEQLVTLHGKRRRRTAAPRARRSRLEQRPSN